jgi:hypothetical protein
LKDPTSPRGADLIARYAVGVLIGFGIVAALSLSTSDWVASSVLRTVLVWLLLAIAATAFAWAIARIGVPQTAQFGWVLFGIGLAFGVYSILSGFQSGYTDESYSTPRYVGLLLAGHDPYSYPLVFTYNQYGTLSHSYSRYVYLPLLMFWQIPGLNYKFFTVLTWGGTVWLLRRDAFAMITMAQPFVAVLAANGYNDFPVLLLLTLAFVGIAGSRSKWAEVLALGSKQFANVITVLYYAVHRDWKRVGVTIGITAAFLAPFLIWNFSATLCNAVEYNLAPGCLAHQASPRTQINYSLYILWIVAVFHRPLMERINRFRHRHDPVGTQPSGNERSGPAPTESRASDPTAPHQVGNDSPFASRAR